MKLSTGVASAIKTTRIIVKKSLDLARFLRAPAVETETQSVNDNGISGPRVNDKGK